MNAVDIAALTDEFEEWKKDIPAEEANKVLRLFLRRKFPDVSDESREELFSKISEMKVSRFLNRGRKTGIQDTIPRPDDGPTWLSRVNLNDNIPESWKDKQIPRGDD